MVREELEILSCVGAMDKQTRVSKVQAARQQVLFAQGNLRFPKRVSQCSLVDDLVSMLVLSYTPSILDPLSIDLVRQQAFFDKFSH